MEDNTLRILGVIFKIPFEKTKIKGITAKGITSLQDGWPGKDLRTNENTNGDKRHIYSIACPTLKNILFITKKPLYRKYQPISSLDTG